MHAFSFLLALAGSLLIACSREASDAGVETTAITSFLTQLDPYGMQERVSVDDLDGARSYVVEQLGAQGIDVELAIRELRILSFGDSHLAGRAVAVLAVLDREALRDEAIAAMDDERTVTGKHPQGSAVLIAWSLLFGSKSHDEAVDRGLELLDSEHPVHRYAGHVLLTLSTLKAVSPDPWRFPHDEPVLEALDRGDWEPFVTGAADDGVTDVVVSALVASNERESPAGIHPYLWQLVVEATSHDRARELRSGSVDAATMGRDLARVTFRDLRMQFHPVQLF